MGRFPESFPVFRRAVPETPGPPFTPGRVFGKLYGMY